MPCSHALLYGKEELKRLGLWTETRRMRRLLPLLAEQGQEGVHVQWMENCAKLIRMKAPAQTYVEGFLCRFFSGQTTGSQPLPPKP